MLSYLLCVLYREGTMLVTASVTGTVLRLFSVPSGKAVVWLHWQYMQLTCITTTRVICCKFVISLSVMWCDVIYDTISCINAPLIYFLFFQYHRRTLVLISSWYPLSWDHLLLFLGTFLSLGCRFIFWHSAYLWCNGWITKETANCGWWQWCCEWKRQWRHE